MSPLKSAASVLEAAQRKRDERLSWLRSLKVGDAVTLSPEGADMRRVVERAVVMGADNDPENGLPWLAVEKWPRRNLRLNTANPGTWRRNGKNWEEMRIDPLGEAKP